MQPFFKNKNCPLLVVVTGFSGAFYCMQIYGKGQCPSLFMTSSSSRH